MKNRTNPRLSKLAQKSPPRTNKTAVKYINLGTTKKGT
jgi:hypothetical protein